MEIEIQNVKSIGLFSHQPFEKRPVTTILDSDFHPVTISSLIFSGMSCKQPILKKMRPDIVTGIQNGIRTVKVHVSFQMSRWKETCNKHSAFWFVFWWLFRISCFREYPRKLGDVTEEVKIEATLFKEKWWDREMSAGREVGLSLQGTMPYVPKLDSMTSLQNELIHRTHCAQLGIPWCPIVADPWSLSYIYK